MGSISGISRGRAINEVAERQMRQWALDMQTQQRLVEEQPRLSVPQLVQPYIALSREAGVDAGELATSIAKVCGWKVFDRELLDYLAEHDHMSRLALELVDERTVSWFHEMFGKWLEGQLVSQAEYVSRLGRLVLLAAQHESSIFVGRGVQFMLPRDRGLVVRLIAPLADRVKCMMKRKQCSEREANRLVAEVDDNRTQFVEHYFHHNIADPHLYDFVINLGFVPRSEAVELIAIEAKRLAERILTESAGRNSAERQLHRLDQVPNST